MTKPHRLGWGLFCCHNIVCIIIQSLSVWKLIKNLLHVLAIPLKSNPALVGDAKHGMGLLPQKLFLDSHVAGSLQLAW